jgi:excisionase family DNA binding protein
MGEIVLTREEAAEVLRLSLRTFDKLLASGEIIPRRVGRRVLIPRTEVERFAKADTSPRVAVSVGALNAAPVPA